MRIPLLFFCVVAFLLTPLELLNAAERFWIASSAKNWNDASGWSETPGGAGGATAPESGDRAFFGAYGAGNCTVTASITVDRIEIASAYTGIVSQSSGVTVMTGSLVVDGAFRLGANGKLQLTDTDVPLSGSGTLDTSTNTPNTVEYAGGDEIEIASGTPVSAYHHLTLTPPGGISRTGVFVGNANEQYYDMAAVDSASGYLYIGTKNSPAKIVKIRLSDFTRVGTLTLASGEKDLSPAVIVDSAAGFMYVGTRTTPGRVVKIQLSDFTRVGAITLNSGEDQLWSAALDGANGYAYFGTRTSPARIVKVQLSDFTRHSALTLASGENEALGACLDAAAGFAYFGLQTYPGKVVKVRLSDFTAMGTLTFNTGEDRIRVGVLDAAAGFAYFSTRTSPGKVVRVKLADFTRDAVLTMESGENELYSGVIDTEGGHAFFGTYTNPGKVIKVKLEDFTRADAVTFGFNEKQLDTAAIDAANGYAYFMTDNWTGKAVKVNLKHVDAEWTHSGALDVNGNLAIGAGVLNSAGQNIAVGGGWSNAGTFNSGLNTVTLDGGSQNVSGHNTFRNLTKIITSAATLTFESGKTQQVAGTLNLQGASGQLLSVRASQSGQPWRLVAENYQTARYADIKDTDASEGRALVALHSSDSGNNANVIFTAPAQVSLSTPNTSVTNPAWVEGTNSADVSSVAVSVNSGTAFNAVRLSPTKWFADNASSGGASFGVTLSPTAATNVEVVVANPFTETNSASQNITWTATNLAGQSYSEDTVRIRKGDSLLLTATGTGTTLEIDGHGDGTFEHSGAPGTLFSTPYPTAGTYVAKARIDSVEVGTLTVVVIGVDLHGPIACEVGFQREKDVDVSPASETGEVSFAANDGFWMTVSVKQAIATGATLYLKPLRRGTPVLEARLNGESGPLLSHQMLDEFTVEIPALFSSIIDSSTNVGGNTLTLRPYIPNLALSLSMFAHTSTFQEGSTNLTINTSDSDPDTGNPLFQVIPDPDTGENIGEYFLTLEVPSNETMYCFNIHGTESYGGEERVTGTYTVNGHTCKARPEQLILCKGASDCEGELGTLFINVAEGDGSKIRVKIIRTAIFFGEGPEFKFPNSCKSETKAPCAQGRVRVEPDVVAGGREGSYDVKLNDVVFGNVIIVLSHCCECEIVAECLCVEETAPNALTVKLTKLTTGHDQSGEFRIRIEDKNGEGPTFEDGTRIKSLVECPTEESFTLKGGELAGEYRVYFKENENPEEECGTICVFSNAWNKNSTPWTLKKDDVLAYEFTSNPEDTGDGKIFFPDKITAPDPDNPENQIDWPIIPGCATPPHTEDARYILMPNGDATKPFPFVRDLGSKSTLTLPSGEERQGRLFFSKEDSCGNKIEYWCIGSGFQFIYFPKDGTPKIAGSCIRLGGQNKWQLFFSECGSKVHFAGSVVYNADIARNMPPLDFRPDEYQWTEWRFDCTCSRQRCEFHGTESPVYSADPESVQKVLDSCQEVDSPNFPPVQDEL